MSGTDSDSDDSREYASIPASPRLESFHHSETDHARDGSDSSKDKKQDVFRVLVTGFGVSFQMHAAALVLIPPAVRPMASQPLLARRPAPAQPRSPDRSRKSLKGTARR
jgi:hypothetical protein